MQYTTLAIIDTQLMSLLQLSICSTASAVKWMTITMTQEPRRKQVKKRNDEMNRGALNAMSAIGGLMLSVKR